MNPNELKTKANELRATRFTDYDAARYNCLQAADLLVREASFLDALVRENAELKQQCAVRDNAIRQRDGAVIDLTAQVNNLTQELASIRAALAESGE